MSAPRPRPMLAAIAIFLASAAVYLLAGPTLAFQPWDSLAYSWECEQHVMAPAWANHPLGHVIGCATYDAIVRTSTSTRAFTVLSTMNGLAAAGAVTLIFWLLTGACRLSTGRAAAWSVVFAASYGFWFYAGTADLYGISACTLAGALLAMVALRERPSFGRAVLAAVLVAVAAFAHQFNAVLIAALSFGLFVDRSPRLRVTPWTVTTTTIAVALTLTSYAMLAHAGAGSWAPGALVHWLVGYGHDPSYGRFFGWHGVLLAGRSIAQTLIGQQAAGPMVALQVIAVIAVVALVAVGRRDRGEGMPRSIVVAAIAACVAGVPLIVWWDPEMYGKWWLLVEPIAIVGLATTRPRAFAGPVAAASVLLVFNGALAMPRVARSDAVLDASLARWTAETTADDVLVENGRLTPFLLFWANRPNTVNLYRILQLSPPGDRFALLRQAFDAARAAGHHVFIVRELDPFYSDERLSVLGVTRAQVQAFLDAAATSPAFPFVQWAGRGDVIVYR